MLSWIVPNQIGPWFKRMVLAIIFYYLRMNISYLSNSLVIHLPLLWKIHNHFIDCLASVFQSRYCHWFIGRLRTHLSWFVGRVAFLCIGIRQWLVILCSPFCSFIFVLNRRILSVHLFFDYNWKNSKQHI